MSSFTETLIVSPLKNGKKWVIRKEFYYYIHEEDGERVTVPVGFITDFASVPRIFWAILPKWGKYGNAAIIHDFLYSTGIKSRKESDKIFLDGMAVLNVPKWKRYAMYYAVRIFGAFNYKSGYKLVEKKEGKIEISQLNIDKRK